MKIQLLWLLFPVVAMAQANVLVNGDFETNPPANMGNNVNHSIAPWNLGTTGQKANVVKVDGPGGYNYGTNGPESDAQPVNGRTSQHYLDIANGSNSFYQSFTPKCTGRMNFGAWFSTRGGRGGTAKITIRQGDGFTGAVVQSNTITLPNGPSTTWKQSNFFAPITANQTYSFVVDMDNEMNIDDAYVRYTNDCPEPRPAVAVNPCCPPWNAQMMLTQMNVTQTGGLTGPIAFSFANAAPFKNQIQAYIDYLHAINPAIKSFVLLWQIYDHGPSGPNTSPSATGVKIGGDEFTEWACGVTSTNTVPCQGFSTTGGGGNLVNGNGSNVFGPLTKYPLQPNRWYRIVTYAYLNDKQTFWNEAQCSRAAIDVTLYAGPAAATPGQPPQTGASQLRMEIRQPGSAQGRIMLMPPGAVRQPLVP